MITVLEERRGRTYTREELLNEGCDRVFFGGKPRILGHTKAEIDGRPVVFVDVYRESRSGGNYEYLGSI